MSVVLCTGDRDWSDEGLVYSPLVQLPTPSTIVHGDARGLDRIAGRIGRILGFQVNPYPAEWGKLHRAAGPIRNQQMLDEQREKGEPIEFVYAWHDDLFSSTGTKDMCRRALKAGLVVTLFSHLHPEGKQLTRIGMA